MYHIEYEGNGVNKQEQFDTIEDLELYASDHNITDYRIITSGDVRAYLKAIGTKGGRSTSPAKQEAVRENGKKGGRPRNR